MFTEMGVGVRPWSIQRRKVMQACSQMYSSSRMMKPFFYTLSNKGVTLQHQLKVLLLVKSDLLLKKALTLS